MDLRAPIPPTHASTQDGSKNDPPLPPAYVTIKRHLLCRMFISAQMMELGSESRFTGLILFHRYVGHFYRLVEKEKHSKQQQENIDMKQIRQHLGQVAAACLFLGCKMSEEPRRIRDVINLSSVLSFCESDDLNDFNSKDQSELIQVKQSVAPPPLDDEYWTAKEEIVSTEQLVLRMLQFDALVCHPYRCVLVVMETLGFGTGLHQVTTNKPESKDDSTKSNTFLTPEQSHRVILDAWALLNEASLDATGGALVYPVVVLSCAAIAVAADGIPGSESVAKDEIDKREVELPEVWWRALDVNTNDIHSAMHSLRKLIQS